MTIIELNIAGLHLTRSTPDYQRVKRSLQRNCRAWRLNRSRHASDRAA